jgi:hypothetical protein
LLPAVASKTWEDISTVDEASIHSQELNLLLLLVNSQVEVLKPRVYRYIQRKLVSFVHQLKVLLGGFGHCKIISNIYSSLSNERGTSYRQVMPVLLAAVMKRSISYCWADIFKSILGTSVKVSGKSSLH